MRLLFSDFLSNLSRAFVRSSREATKESVELAREADEALGLEVEIGGVPLKIEGVANLPRRILMSRRMKFSTEAFLDLDDEGALQVTLKRGLLKSAPKIEIEMEFERSQPLESLEIVRDRAVEVTRTEVQKHKIKVAAGGQNLTVEALEEMLSKLKEDKGDGSANE